MRITTARQRPYTVGTVMRGNACTHDYDYAEYYDDDNDYDYDE